jgi:hypothetical protein
MCAKMVREKYRHKIFLLRMFTPYISKSNRNQICIIHKGKRNIHVGKNVFCPRGGIKKKANARVLEDVTSFLSNSSGSSNSSQQWGLKSPEEILVKI